MLTASTSRFRLSRPLLTTLGLSVLLVTLPACDSDPVDDGTFDEAEANIGQWTFIEVEGAQCRDGSDTGFGIRLQEGADDLMIYLEGGGACFNSATCAGNPSSFDEVDFGTRVPALSSGVFSTGSDNPVGDWNMVYVPYCTGDVHGGSNPDTNVLQAPGVGPQQFVGHLNIERYLDLLAPYLNDTDQVLLTGASAGGFGSLVNFPAVADAFDDSDLTLLDDSGPIFFADDVFSPAIGGLFSLQYNLPATLPEATALFQTDGLQGIYDFLDDEYPDATFGLASHLEDGTIRFFFGQPDGQISGDEFAAGLRDVRDRLPDSWGTYFATGADHTFLGVPSRYTGASAGVTFDDWLADLLDDNPTNVDPDMAARTVASR